MAMSPGRYRLDGTFLEACSCASPCPCLSGQDPDHGRCEATTAYRIDVGDIGGVDVSGLAVVNVVQIPGNVLIGNWRQVLFVDDRATTAQRSALVEVFSGKLGGPLGELATLVGDRVGVHSAAIDYSVQPGLTTLRVTTRAAAVAGSAKPLADAAQVGMGSTAKVNARVEVSADAPMIADARCAVVPSAPARLSEAPNYEVNVPEHAMIWSFSGRNGIYGTFQAES
jgi:hypothetical protein